MDRYREMYAAIPDTGLGGYIQPTLDSLGDVAVRHPDASVVLTVVLLTTTVLVLALRHVNNNKRPIDEVEEMKKRAILDQKYADAFGDKLFDMLCADEIDRHEYKRACRRFGIAYRLGDLLTRKNPKRGLKFRVRHHCAEMHATPSMVGKIPGPKIGTEAPAAVLVVKRKVWLVAGKALLRRKSAT